MYRHGFARTHTHFQPYNREGGQASLQGYRRMARCMCLLCRYMYTYTSSFCCSSSKHEFTCKNCRSACWTVLTRCARSHARKHTSSSRLLSVIHGCILVPACLCVYVHELRSRSLFSPNLLTHEFARNMHARVCTAQVEVVVSDIAWSS